MKILTRIRTALVAVSALMVLPAGVAAAQQAGCVVVDGQGSATGRVECPPENGSGGVGGVGGVDEGDQGDGGDDVNGDQDRAVGGVGVVDEGDQGDGGVVPGRIERPQGAPDGDDTDGAPTVVSADEDELAATGASAETIAVAALATLTLGGGALAASRRRQRTES